MEKIILGRTGLSVSRTGFGALPVQRTDLKEAIRILRKAFNSGINFFDTARGYSDSEEKIGCALSEVRKDIIIATKTHARDKKTFFEHLETSLKNLKTDYIDIYQLHNPRELPDPNNPDSLYSALVEAKKRGMIRFVGITNHRISNALQAAASQLYDTIQFPLSSLSSDTDLSLIEVCKKNNVGVIAMKALAGGLITNVSTSFAFLRQYENLVPIWGIQKESELDEFLTLEKAPPPLDEEMMKLIILDRKELAGSFCRGCGYCMPCPEGIPINTAARITFLMERSPYQGYLTDQWKQQMDLIDNCSGCGQCSGSCPYGLNTPKLLRKMLKEYREFYANHV